MTRLVVVRDTCSPLYVIRCATPCGRRGAQWCQGEEHGRALCWLGSALDEANAQRARERMEATAR